MDSDIGIIFLSAVYLFCAILWLLPVILVGGSNRTSGKEKLIWLLATLLFSWLAWLLHLLLAPLSGSSRRSKGSY